VPAAVISFVERQINKTAATYALCVGKDLKRKVRRPAKHINVKTLVDKGLKRNDV
jgi:hypothetical protein